MTQIDLSLLDQPALGKLRLELLARGSGSTSNLSEEDLILLLAVHARLRSLTSGPPAKAFPRTAKKKPTLDLGDIPG